MIRPNPHFGLSIPARLVYQFGEARPTVEKTKESTQEPTDAQKEIADACQSVEKSDQYSDARVLLSKDQCIQVCEKSSDQNNPEAKLLQGNLNSDPNHPEVLNKVSEGVSKEAFATMVHDNPSAALALSSLYKGVDRIPFVIDACINASSVDPRATLESASLVPQKAVTPALKQAFANAKKADPFTAKRLGLV